MVTQRRLAAPDTARDVHQLGRDLFTGARDVTSGGARLLSAVGAEPRWAQAEMRRQDVGWLRGLTRRYNEQIGVQQNRSSFDRVGKNTNTPVFQSVKESLLIGDVQEARQTMRVWMHGKSKELQDSQLASLMASVRADQPIRAGAAGGEAMRINFLSWARENLSTDDLLRVRDIDKTYRDTAVRLRLMKPASDISSEDLAEAMRKIEMKSQM